MSGMWRLGLNMAHSCPEFTKAVETFTILDRRGFHSWEDGYYINANDCTSESDEMIIRHCPFCGSKL